MQFELERIFGRPVDLVDKQSVQESPNYIRRRAVLDSAERLCTMTMRCCLIC